MATQVDPEASLRYIDTLHRYYSDQILDAEGFRCRSEAACRRSAESREYGFAAGQLSYVGSAYACHEQDRPLRILVVSMQVGDSEAPVSMARRAEQIRARISGRRNPHMRGVTRALQLLHGLPLGQDSEFLSPDVHVLSAYSMANSVLCSALPTGGRSRRGKPTPTMLSECSRHLRSTVSLLKPTIIHTQGVDTLAAIESVVTSIDRASDEVSIVELDGRKIVLCATSHPAAGPPKSWSSIAQGSYFDLVVRPALELARQLAVGES